MAASFKTIMFYIGIGIDVIAVLIALYFIVTDSIGFTSADNTGLTIATVLFCGWIGLCWWLKSKGSVGWGTALAWVPAIPLVLYGIMILLFVILKPDMR